MSRHWTHIADNLRISGGIHLRTVRTWVQNNVKHGDSITWASNDKITLTMQQLEDLSVEIAARVQAEIT